MSEKTDVQQVHQEAFFYLELNLPIIPLCPHDHAGMPSSHRQKCGAPGKSPLLPKWTARGVPGEDEVEQWFGDNPNINLGLILGNTGHYNLVGIDVDGDSGERLLEEHARGILPPTWEFKTGNGRRLIYALPEGAASKKVTTKGDDGELAFLATGQQTVIPPSTHPSGSKYEWKRGKSPKDIEIADAPQWLLNQVQIEDEVAPGSELVPQNIEQTVEEDDWQQTVPKGQRNNHLTKLAGSLIARRNLPKEQIIEFLRHWNNKHCDPPLPDDEIVTMVENLHAVEQSKAEQIQQKRQQQKEALRPTSFVKEFLKLEEDEGILWKYCVQRGLFYRCNTFTGPWEPVDGVYVQKALRGRLVEKNEAWDSQRHVNEAFYAMKEWLANPDNDDLFDIGKHGDTNHIYLANGMLDWKNLELKPWDPETYSTIQLDAKWDENAKDFESYEKWQNVLAQWIPDEETRMFLQEYIGYCLIPDASFRTAVFLYGGGSNGKSLFLDVVSKLFEGYISFVPLHWLNERFETAKIMDKLINVCGDVDSKYMTETSTLKALIAGDPIRAEHKHGRSFHFHPVARLMFSANQLPRASDKTEAWYGRWKFIEFPRRFNVDPSFKRDLMMTFSTPKAKSALLMWAVEGLRRLQEQGNFTVSKPMRESENQYKLENDSVHAFANTMLKQVAHEGLDTLVTVPSIYHMYKWWCEDMGVKAVSQYEFTRRAQTLGFRKGPRVVQGSSVNCLLGVQFTDHAVDGGYLDEYMFNEATRVNTKRKSSAQ